MLKLMSEYKYHSGIRLRIYPSHQQKRIIKKNAETARFIYNEMIACSKEIAAFGKLSVLQNEFRYCVSESNPSHH